MNPSDLCRYEECFLCVLHICGVFNAGAIILVFLDLRWKCQCQLLLRGDFGLLHSTGKRAFGQGVAVILSIHDKCLHFTKSFD